MELRAAASSLALLRSSAPPAPSPAPPRPSSAPGATSCCIFCSGTIPLLGGAVYNKRKRSLSSLSQFVLARCQPTPYAYRYFSAVRGEDRVMLCISCVNWQRRGYVARRKKAAGRRQLLLADQVALFMLRPGTVPFPDQRCVLRLLTALRDPGDDWVPRLLFGLMPLPVQTMIGMLPPCMEGEGVMRAIVRVWWEYNGRTVFFASHLTAKLVRKMVKSDMAAIMVD
jgi:hypothetical protein